MNPEADDEMRWRYFSQGRAEGWLEGRMDVVLEQLALRFGAVPAMAEVRIRSATREELDRIADAVLTAGTLVEALLSMTGSKFRYQSDFARTPFEKGKAEGKLQGRADIVHEQPDLLPAITRGRRTRHGNALTRDAAAATPF